MNHLPVILAAVAALLLYAPLAEQFSILRNFWVGALFGIVVSASLFLLFRRFKK